MHCCVVFIVYIDAFVFYAKCMGIIEVIYNSSSGQNPYNPASMAASRAGTGLAPAAIRSLSQDFVYVFNDIWNKVIKNHNKMIHSGINKKLF